MNYFTTRNLLPGQGNFTNYNMSSYDRYLRQLFIIIETITSVGFTSPNPNYSLYLIAPILTMWFSSLIFAYDLGKFQNIVEKYTEESNITKTIISKVKKFMDKHKIHKRLRFRIISYIHYMREVQTKHYNGEAELLLGLSDPLKIEIFTYTRSSILVNHKIFKNYNTGFIKFVGYNMKIQIFSAGDLIFQEGELGKTIYFIINGSVDIYNRMTSTVYKTLKKSKSFGEISFFMKTQCTASARCDSFSELAALSRDTFDRVVRRHPAQQKITYELTKMAEKDLGILGIKCYLCRKFAHIAKNCKEFLIKKNSESIIKKANIKHFWSKKKINPGIEVDNKFNRPVHNYDHFSKYKLRNTLGIPNKRDSRIRTLEKKASNFFNNLRIFNSSINKLKPENIECEEDNDEELFKPVLPESKQYGKSFMKAKMKSSGFVMAKMNRKEKFPTIVLTLVK